MKYKLCKLEINHYTDDCEFLNELRCSDYAEILTLEKGDLLFDGLKNIKIDKIFEVVNFDIFNRILRELNYDIFEYFKYEGHLIGGDDRVQFKVREIIESFWKHELSNVKVDNGYLNKDLYVLHERVYIDLTEDDNNDPQILEFKLYFEEI